MQIWNPFANDVTLTNHMGLVTINDDTTVFTGLEIIKDPLKMLISKSKVRLWVV